MRKEKELPSGKAERLEFIYRSLSNGIRTAKAKVPREWLAKKGLSIELTGACFNSGQIHHRKDEGFKTALAEVGFMQKSNAVANCDSTPYTVFGIFSVMFPLRNKENEIVNFYSVRIRSENKAYMNQEAGLYPAYPHQLTKRLFVVNSVLEAATLIQSKVLDNREAVIALHDGILMPEHQEAIKRLTKLEELIYIHSTIPSQEKEKSVWNKPKNERASQHTI